MEVALGYFEDDGTAEYDLSKPPMSGIDYLKRVQIEAANCPDVVIVKPDPSEVKNKKQQDFVLSEIKTQLIDGTKIFPPETRQLSMAEEFAYLRQKLNRVKADASLCSITKSAQLPGVGTVQVLCRFCYGKDFSAQYLEASLKGQKGQISNTGANGQGNAPLLGTLMKLKQSAVIKLLNFNLKWLEVIGFSYDQGCWIFGLLLCLDKPMPSEVTACIRELCRRVISIRNSLTSPETENYLHQLNLIIIIVTRFFGQSDLLIAN